MHPLLRHVILSPQGVPRNGLVGEYMPCLQRNLLTLNQSDVETGTAGFNSFASSISRVTDEAWFGGASLRVITANSNANEGVFTSPRIPTIDNLYTASAYVKGSGTIRAALVEFAGLVGANLGNTNSIAVTLTNEWQRISVSRQFATGNAAVGAVWTNVKQDITFYVDGFQLERGSLAPWHPGYTQSLYNQYGSIGNGALGSTTEADTNDPVFTGQSLLFATDDYVRLPYSIDANGDFTVFVVVKRDGNPAAEEGFWSLGNSAADTPAIAVSMHVTRAIGVFVRNDAGDSALDSLAFAGTGYFCICFKKQGASFTLKLLPANTTLTVNGSGNFTINRCGLGALLRVAVANYLNGEIAACLEYNRALSDEEDTRVYKYLKAILADRGITI